MYSEDGKLLWYRSTNFGSKARLRKGASAVLDKAGPTKRLVIEGGGDLSLPWIHEAERRGIKVRMIQAHVWRNELLHSRQQRSGLDAKKHADALARRIISWSGTRKPTSLRHDAAEAICVGMWGVIDLGWLKRLPTLPKR